MIYLSKGLIRKDYAKSKPAIARGNSIFILDGLEAEIWLEGQFKIASLPEKKDYEDALFSLCSKGLAEFEYQSDMINQFRLLSRCICCPSKSKIIGAPFNKCEKTAIKWLSKAGINLTTAELTYLFEHSIMPISPLLSEDNRQALVETIYNKNNIYDNILESQMEKAACRNEVITVILTLLQKKRIVML